MSESEQSAETIEREDYQDMERARDILADIDDRDLPDVVASDIDEIVDFVDDVARRYEVEA